jgi:hypothetical protein
MALIVVGDVGVGLGETGLAAQPVQFAVASALVFPVEALFDHHQSRQSPGSCCVGEVFEVLGHAF